MIVTYAIHNEHIIIPAQVNPSFPNPNYIIWKGPLPHKYTPVWVTYVRESLGGVTGVGGDPNQVPTVGEFFMVIASTFYYKHYYYEK